MNEKLSKTFAEMRVNPAFAVRVAYVENEAGKTRRALQILTGGLITDTTAEDLREIFPDDKNVRAWLDRNG